MQCIELHFDKRRHQIRQAEQWLVWVNEKQEKKNKTAALITWTLVAFYLDYSQNITGKMKTRYKT